jgi:catechol 1,2-dioxygenase
LDVEEAGMATDTPDELKLIPDDLNVVELDLSKVNKRVIEVVDAFAGAIEDVVRRMGVTYEEYDLFRRVVTELGPYMTGIWDPWISPMLERLHGAGRTGTSANPEGPFYVPGAPQLDAPYSLMKQADEPGDPLIVRGQVRSEGGAPLDGAEFDLWQCNAKGFYSNFGMSPNIVDWDFRGKFPTDEQGHFEFRTIKPPPYRNVGTPQIVEDFFAALGRSQFRPAHIHIAINHPALPERYLTQLYFASDPYRDYDVGAAVREDLVATPVLHEEPAEIDAAGFGRAYYTVDFDFVLTVKQKVATQ